MAKKNSYEPRILGDRSPGALRRYELRSLNDQYPKKTRGLGQRPKPAGEAITAPRLKTWSDYVDQQKAAPGGRKWLQCELWPKEHQLP